MPFLRRYLKLKMQSRIHRDRCRVVKALESANMINYALTKNAICIINLNRMASTQS